MTTRAEREQAIAEAGYSTFLLYSEDVYIDLLTDSGRSAMSDRQWVALTVGDDAYAGRRSYYRFEAAVGDVYGYEKAVPTSCGRSAATARAPRCRPRRTTSSLGRDIGP